MFKFLHVGWTNCVSIIGFTQELGMIIDLSCAKISTFDILSTSLTKVCCDMPFWRNPKSDLSVILLRPYTCKHCAKTFYRWDAWKRHETRHESKGEVRAFTHLNDPTAHWKDWQAENFFGCLVSWYISIHAVVHELNRYPTECFVHPSTASCTRKISYLRWMRKRICFWIQAKNPSTATHRRETVLMPVNVKKAYRISLMIK